MSNSWTNSWDQAITEAIKNNSSLSKEEIEEILLEREQVQRLVNPPYTETYISLWNTYPAVSTKSTHIDPNQQMSSSQSTTTVQTNSKSTPVIHKAPRLSMDQQNYMEEHGPVRRPCQFEGCERPMDEIFNGDHWHPSYPNGEPLLDEEAVKAAFSDLLLEEFLQQCKLEREQVQKLVNPPIQAETHRV